MEFNVLNALTFVAIVLLGVIVAALKGFEFGEYQPAAENEVFRTQMIQEVRSTASL